MSTIAAPAVQPVPALRGLAGAVFVLLVLYLAGAVWGAAEGFASFGDALLNGTYISAPLPIIGVQLVGAAIALRGGRPRAGAALTLLPCTASLAAVAFDGDLGHAGLDGVHVAYQVVITTVTVVTWCAAALVVARRTAAARPRRVA
jgi:hypothetical protein